MRFLLDRGVQQVRILDNLSVGQRSALPEHSLLTEEDLASGTRPTSPLELVVGDIMNANLVNRAAASADVMVHLAANAGVQLSIDDPLADMIVNVQGTVHCLEAARRNSVRRFVFASSGAPIGEVQPPIHEELPCHPTSPYGASKLAGEGYCSAYSRSFGVGAVALRFGNVYGPGSGHKTSVVAKFLRNALDGHPLEIYGDGCQTRDFVYIDDLLDAIFRAGSVPGIGGEVFQIATNSETTVNQLAQLIVDLFEGRGLPRPALKHSPLPVGDVRRNYSDVTKAEKTLGWRARVPLAEGLERTLDWFCDRV